MGVNVHAVPMLYHVYVIAFVVAIGTAVAFTYAVRNVAIARGWSRLPDSERHIHHTATPRLGGVAIFAAFVNVSSALLATLWLTGTVDRTFVGKIFSLLLPVSIVFLAGLYDDFCSIRPWVKIAAQVCAGILLFLDGFRVAITPSFFFHDLGWLGGLILTVFWTALITNAFNLIDGLDGLAAGSALFSTLAMFVVALAMHNGSVALLTAVLAGAIIGFLRYNFNPATIFLGDCGSQMLGFMLAALSLAGATQQKSSTIIAVAIPIVAFGFPIVETTISVLRRFITGQPIFAADSHHIHHKLIARGMSHRGAVVLLYAVSATISLLSLPLLAPQAAPVAIVFAILGIGIIVGVQRLYYHEVLELGRIARRTLEQRPIIMNNLAIRRGSEALWSARDFDSIRSALDTAFANNAFDAIQLVLTSERNAKHQFTHSWAPAAEPFVWSMSLDLVDAAGRRLGELTMKRCRHSELQLDINLLCAELVPALVAACGRVLYGGSPEPVAKPVAAIAVSEA